MSNEKHQNCSPLSSDGLDGLFMTTEEKQKLWASQEKQYADKARWDAEEAAIAAPKIAKEKEALALFVEDFSKAEYNLESFLSLSKKHNIFIRFEKSTVNVGGNRYQIMVAKTWKRTIFVNPDEIQFPFAFTREVWAKYKKDKFGNGLFDPRELSHAEREGMFKNAPTDAVIKAAREEGYGFI